MPARVLDVGNCAPDHAAVRELVTANFDAEVDPVMYPEQAVEAIERRRYDLVLVNRLIFDDPGREGIELVRALQERNDAPPVMLISNHEEAQRAAVAAGAQRGFGKDHLRDAATAERLRSFLPPKTAK